MYFDRPALKRGAKQAMRATRPHAMLVTLLYLLLTSGSTFLVSLFVADPATLFSELLDQGLAPAQAIYVALSKIGPLGLFLHILLAALGSVLLFGYHRWALTSSRSNEAGMDDLFCGFSMAGKILWLAILSTGYCLFWGLMLFMAGSLLALVLSMIPFIGFIIFCFLCLIGAAFLISRVLQCAMATYCLSDAPEQSALQALRRSIQLMKGQTRHFFFLYLSFIGWSLLMIPIVLLGGLCAIASSGLATIVTLLASLPLELWLTAYITFAECRFYDRLLLSQPTYEL